MLSKHEQRDPSKELQLVSTLQILPIGLRSFSKVDSVQTSRGRRGILTQRRADGRGSLIGSKSFWLTAENLTTNEPRLPLSTLLYSTSLENLTKLKPLPISMRLTSPETFRPKVHLVIINWNSFS